MVLAYSLDQAERIQNVFFILLYLVRFLRSSLRKVRAIERFYAFITLGYRQNHKLQPRFVGLGLVVREWYWPIPWTRRKRFRIYFSFCCISHGFGGVVDGKYEKQGGIIIKTKQAYNDACRVIANHELQQN